VEQHGVTRTRAMAAVRTINVVDELAERIAGLLGQQHGDAAEAFARGVTKGIYTKRGMQAAIRAHHFSTIHFCVAYLGLREGMRAFAERGPVEALASVVVAASTLLAGMEDFNAERRTAAAQKGAAAKLAKDTDGKQAGKAQVRKLWEEWKAGKTRHRSGAAFALDALGKVAALKSTKKIETWVTEWGRERERRNRNPA
jgi:hypothetical protein